jgi:hypothetical protein
MKLNPVVLAILNEAEGAWPNGATVRKANSQPDDATPNGALGTILGSADVRSQGKPAAYVYCVVWDDKPGLPVMCSDTNNDGTPRLEPVTS